MAANDGPMPICKSGIVAAGVYLAVEVLLFVDACLHPSGLGYEFIPFAFLTLPWYFLLRALPFPVIGMSVGLLANMVTIYYDHHGISITVQGRAMANGVRNETIAVQNLTSHKIFNARVVDERSLVYDE